MGRIKNPVKLQELIQNFDIKNFVETGSGNGTSMNDVFQLNLVEKLYGIELAIPLYEDLKNKFNGIHFYNGYSKDELPNVLNDLNPNPTLYWLDAHFPFSEYQFNNPYDSEPDVTKRIPLEIELRIIKESRDVSKDIFIMDDLRIYVDRPYTAGNWDMRNTAGYEGYDFVEEILGDTHVIIEHHGDEGYLLAYPILYSEEEIKSTIRFL